VKEFQENYKDESGVEENLNNLEEMRLNCIQSLKQVERQLPNSYNQLNTNLIDKLLSQLNENCVSFFKIIFKPDVCYVVFLLTHTFYSFKF
jgi:hypothetical protein